MTAGLVETLRGGRGSAGIGAADIVTHLDGPGNSPGDRIR
jgi:hypothetical protein